PIATFIGTDTFTYRASDGTFTSNLATVTIHVTTNQPPVNTVPGPQTILEDTTQAIGGISVSDPDNNVTTVALSVTNGTLNVTLAGGASIFLGRSSRHTMSIRDWSSDVCSTDLSLTYRGVLNYNGADTLTVTSTDAASA